MVGLFLVFTALFSISLVFAGCSDELLIAIFLDSRVAAVDPDIRRNFLLRMKRNGPEEYNMVLDRLVFLYMKHFYKPEPSQSPLARPRLYTEYGTNYENQKSEHLLEFVEGMPHDLLTKFVMVPPCLLRRAMRERARREYLNVLDVFDLLDRYILPYGPYTEILNSDMEEFMMDLPPNRLARVRRLIEASRQKVSNGTPNNLVRIASSFSQLAYPEYLDGHPIRVDCANMVEESAQVTQPRAIQSVPKSLRLSLILWPDLPSEVGDRILSSLDNRMRLVNKAASFSHLFPGSPSHPLQFLTVLCGDKLEWRKMAWALTGAYNQLSEYDIEMIRRFFKCYSSGSFELTKFYNETCNNPNRAFDQAIAKKMLRKERKPYSSRSFEREKFYNNRPYYTNRAFNHAITKKMLQSERKPPVASHHHCLLASLVFEIGAFGAECERTVKDLLLAIARLYHPDIVQQLEQARDEHLKGDGDICALAKDLRVPCFWTFVFYGDLSETTNMKSIRRILVDDESREALANIASSFNPKDHHMVRIISERLDELRLSSKGDAQMGNDIKLLKSHFSEHRSMNSYFHAYFAVLLKVPEKVESYFEGCLTNMFVKGNCPAAPGSILAQLLLNLLKAFYGDHTGNLEQLAARNAYGDRYKSGFTVIKVESLKLFLDVLRSMRICDIPIQEIIEYLESREQDLFFNDDEIECFSPLIEALIYSPLVAFPGFVIKFFSRLDRPDLLSDFTQSSVRKGASLQQVSDFMSQCGRVSQVTITSAIMGRRSPRLNYAEEEVFIRIVVNESTAALPNLLLIPGDATVLELYCRVAELFGEFGNFLLKNSDDTVMLPSDDAVRNLANQTLKICVGDQVDFTVIWTFLK